MPDDAPGPSRRRPLSGADLFTRVLDREARVGGLPGFQSMVLLELETRPDADRLIARLAADTDVTRSLRARLIRNWPWRRPVWDVTLPGPVAEVRVLDAEPTGASPWPALLGDPLRPALGENLRVTIFPVADGSWRVACVFHHILCDARAAERLLASLSTGDPACWPDLPAAGPRPGLAERFRRMRAQTDVIEAAAGGPIHRFADRADGPVDGLGAAVAACNADETRAIVAVGRAAAGYGMEGLWALACLLAADRDTDPRPAARERYLVPLPTTLDRVGESARAFGNHLVFQFLSAPVATANRPGETARAFRAQMLAELRSGAADRCTAQLDLCGGLPAPLYAFLARGSTGGAFGSLFFSNPGPVDARLQSFLGAEVRAVAHLPAPLPVPGICATIWTFRDRWSLGLTWARGRVTDARAAALLARWRERLARPEDGR